MSVLERYRQFKATIPSGVDIVLATKYATKDDIIELSQESGIIAGENRVQALLEKYDEVCEKSVNKITWHFIGHLQTNKVKYIIDKVDLIHSVDSEKLMREIDKQAKKVGKTQKILIEINFFDEKSKTGTHPDELCKLLDMGSELENVTICGVMLMFPRVYDTVMTQKCKAFVVDICDSVWHNTNIPTISMGMSGDYKDAIGCGSNMIRIGSLIFK
jgi:pyridoxal phosphate enzyme (YggS family)